MKVPVILASLLITGPAVAQPDFAAMGRAAAANQLGVLEYCKSHGDVGDDAVAAQRAAMARMPASSAPTDAAEALGQNGTFASPNGQKMALSDVASQQHTTISALCKQLGSSAVQSEAATRQLGANGGMPSMPAMPGMPSGMPSGMPGGMPGGLTSVPGLPSGMPSMPGMPTMPGMPQTPGIPGR